jgi:hypothetical protein
MNGGSEKKYVVRGGGSLSLKMWEESKLGKVLDLQIQSSWRRQEEICGGRGGCLER